MTPALARPEGWDLRGHFPDPHEPGSELSHHWDVMLDGPIQLEGLEYRLEGPLSVDVTLRRERGAVVAVMELAGQVITQCCRCLCDLPVAIREKFMYSYTACHGTDEKEPEEAYADPVIDLQVSRLTGPVELGDLVWECFLVSLPRYASCEGECEAPIRWENDTSDLRFGVFAQLLNTEKGGNQDGDA